MTLQALMTAQRTSQPVCPQGLAISTAEINRALDRQAATGAASEEFLQAQLELMPIDGPGQAPALGSALDLGGATDYWPTLARLAELTLFSAGTLAMAGDFTGCGDLMVNPPIKLLHVKGRPLPFALKRHGAITRQVAHLVPPGWETIEWLKHQTFIEIPRKALLPRLRSKLEGCPQPGSYLVELDRDLDILAGSLGLLMSLDAESASGPQGGWARLSLYERRSLQSRLYHPNLRRFHEVGRMITGKEGGGRGG